MQVLDLSLLLWQGRNVSEGNISGCMLVCGQDSPSAAASKCFALSLQHSMMIQALGYHPAHAKLGPCESRPVVHIATATLQASSSLIMMFAVQEDEHSSSIAGGRRSSMADIS